MQTHFGPLTNPEKLSQRICHVLEDAIVKGTYGVDKRLPTEAKLCETFGVSRTSLREALQHLKSRGLIESIAGRGMFVRALTQSFLERDLSLFSKLNDGEDVFLEFQDFRLLIEPENARRAAANKNPQCIAALKDSLARMDVSLNDLPEFVVADIAMHLRIAREAGNRFIEIILSGLKPMGEDYGRHSYDSTSLMRKAYREHEQIYRAISQGDVTTAGNAMHDHLVSSIEDYRKLLSKKKSASSLPKKRHAIKK